MDSPIRWKCFGWLVAVVLCLAPGPVAAANIALWDFESGTANDQSGSPTAYDLASFGGGPVIANGFARFGGDDSAPSYLEVVGAGGMPEYTVSLWVRSQGAIDQGTFQGIFSNNASSTASFSWQVESYNGVYQWRNQAGTFAIGAPSALNNWDHIVVRKFGGNNGDIWLNGVPVVTNLGANPGGLQYFRLGANRNTNRLWEGDVDNVYVFNTLEDPNALYVNTIPNPEPTTALLLLLGLGGLGYAGRRRSPSLSGRCGSRLAVQ